MNLYESIKNNLKESSLNTRFTFDDVFTNDANKKIKIKNVVFGGHSIKEKHPNVSDMNPVILYEISAQDYEKEPKVEYANNLSMLKEDFIKMLIKENFIKEEQNDSRIKTLNDAFGYDKILEQTDLGKETEFVIQTGGDIMSVLVDDLGNSYIK